MTPNKEPKDEEISNALRAIAFLKAETENEARGSLKLNMDDWETLLEFIDNFVDLPEDIKRIHGELEEQFVDMEELQE